MGWWKINNVLRGQISWNQPGKKKLINVIPGEDKNDAMYNGGEPADTMSTALEEINAQYVNS